MKQSVKKGSAKAANYAAARQAERELWTVKVIAYTQQEILDAVEITLHSEFGFGPERQHRFHDAFMEKFRQIQTLRNGDDDYAIAKIEQALQAACGDNYQPREARYDFKLITKTGEKIKL